MTTYTLNESHAFSVLVPSTRTTPVLILASVIKGLGGGEQAILAANLAFVADSTATASRSFYFGLVLIASSLSTAAGFSTGIALIYNEAIPTIFYLAIVSWSIYALCLFFVLGETQTHSVSDATLSHSLPGRAYNNYLLAVDTSMARYCKFHANIGLWWPCCLDTLLYSYFLERPIDGMSVLITSYKHLLIIYRNVIAGFCFGHQFFLKSCFDTVYLTCSNVSLSSPFHLKIPDFGHKRTKHKQWLKHPT